MNKIIEWINYLEKNKDKGKWRWIIFGILGLLLGISVVVISLFTKEDANEKLLKKRIKDAQKSNDDSVKSGYTFLRKRTKFQRKKL